MPGHAHSTTRIVARAIPMLGVFFSLAAWGDPGDALDTGGGGISSRYVVHARQELENGHITDAIALCNKALALHPYFINARFTRGRAELAAGENDKAIDDFTQVIAAYPEYPMVYGYRGQAQLYAKRPIQAIADFNKAFAAPVGGSSYMAANILSFRSVAFELAGQGDAAMADFKEALNTVAITDHDWSMLNNHCYAAAVVGLLQMAALSCDESIARHTRDLSVYDSRGLAELKSGEWDKAAADYTQSLYYRPALSFSLYGRALARRATGDVAGAASDTAAALASEPDIAAILTRLGVKPPPH